MRTLGAAPGRPGTPSLAAASLTTTHCSGSRVTAATGARLPRGASTGAQGSITALVAFTEQHDVVIIVVVVGKCTFVLGNRALHRRSANGFGEFGVPHSSAVTHNRHHKPVFST